jgi:dTDP-4-dehydrorhamnose 3,5-epimerase
MGLPLRLAGPSVGTRAVIFEELSLAGVFAVEPEPVLDERGLFARTYDMREFAEHGLEFDVAQASVSFNARRGTLRGMHLQTPPHGEAKLIRCVAGSVHDVVVDLRAGSPTQLQWLEVELSVRRRNALYLPPGLAHGFLTLVDECELDYLISKRYEPAASVGVRWDDPSIGIEWPFAPLLVSERDAAFPDLDVDLVREQGPGALA